MADISTLQVQADKLLVEAQKLLLADDFNAEKNEQAQRMIADSNAIETRIASLVAIDKSQKAQIAASQTFEKSPRGNAGVAVEGTVEERKAKFNAAFRDYALNGRREMSRENRDLLTTTDAAGGALIPQEFLGTLVEAVKFYGPTASAVQQKVTDNNGRPIKISYSNDTSNGLTVLATEGTSGPVETDPTFFSKVLGVDTVTGGLVKISFEELQDSAFDLDTWLRTAFGKRYGRGMETAITLGKDSSGNTLANQATGGLAGVATLGSQTSALANGIGWDDLAYTLGALDPAYVNDNSKWVLSNTTKIYLLGLKDGFGRPYFTPDPANGRPFAKLLGYDIVINQALPSYNVAAPVANQVPILFGDLESAYMARTDGQPSIRRLDERYADTLEVGFFMWTRIGGISLNAGISPLVSLKLAAS